MTIVNYFKNKKILITGASGFVGYEFVSFFKNMNMNVIPFSREKQSGIFDYEKLRSQMRGVDIVINCAALDGNAQFKQKNSAFILSQNTIIISNLMEICRLSGVKQTVLLSSADIYPRESIAPFKEEDDYIKYPHYDFDGYVLSKIYLELLGKKYADEFSMNVLILRPTNIFGVRDKKARIIPTIINKIQQGEQIPILGSGLQKRNFISIEDFVNISANLMSKGAQGIYNIGTEEVVSINELVEIISKMLNKNAKIRYDNDIEDRDRYLDITKLKKMENYKISSIRESLKSLF